MAIDINDLPATSPHGSYSEHDARNLGFATDPHATRGTATAHLGGRWYMVVKGSDSQKSRMYIAGAYSYNLTLTEGVNRTV